MPHETFQVGDLTAVIGDNSAAGEHLAGYNGVWSLRHRLSDRNLFVPAYAGLNHEHIFNGETEDDRQYFFEPRTAPMTFTKISNREAELHQPPTPMFRVESRTRFKLTAPHYLDMHYTAIAHQHVFPRGWLGLFWASYLNAPDDKSLYFRGAGGWQQHCTPTHNTLSTVLHESDQFKLTFSEKHRDCLYKSFSPLRYSQPLYYGLFRGMILILMFDRTEGIRFAHSPSGGGFNKEAQTSNPAWDFQYILPKYEVAKMYEFRARMIYRERCSRAAVLAEYESWRKTRK